MLGAPTTSNLNVLAGDIVPNAVTVQLPTSGGDAGKIEITFDAYGTSGPTTDILVDVVGYYVAGAAATGPAGPPGPAGPAGPAGPRGFSAWDTIPSGQTVIGSESWDFFSPAADHDVRMSVSLPARTPTPLTGPTVNFSPDALAADDDAACTGSPSAPTAPPGKVCIYRVSNGNVGNMTGLQLTAAPDTGFRVRWLTTGAGDMYLNVSWAYTAP